MITEAARTAVRYGRIADSAEKSALPAMLSHCRPATTPDQRRSPLVMPSGAGGSATSPISARFASISCRGTTRTL
ncbi:hypothetical protein GCM10009780_38630 [Actinomadura alba]